VRRAELAGARVIIGPARGHRRRRSRVIEDAAVRVVGAHIAQIGRAASSPPRTPTTRCGRRAAAC
jgi:hypothetical protein